LIYNNYSYSHLQFEISLMNLKTSGIRWSQPYRSPILSTDTLCREAERLVTTAKCTSKTTNSNSVLPRTASNDIQQHVNSANSGDVDIRNLTITLMRTVVLQRSWYKMPGCLVQ
jgi:PBP1b-binding outer membrane lipoprotein LpoB